MEKSNGHLLLLSFVGHFLLAAGCTGEAVSDEDDDTDTTQESIPDDDSDSSFVFDSEDTSSSTTDTDTDAPNKPYHIDDLPWPTETTGLPPCTPHPDGLDPPETAAASGQIRILLSAPLQPVGVEERLQIEILDSDGDELDLHADGTLFLESIPEADIIEISSISSGRAQAFIVFQTSGPHTLTAGFAEEDGDERTGSVEMTAYETQLPIWEMTIDDSDLDEITSNPHERIKVPILLTVNGVSYESEVRLHGGSSRGYPKKSFRFDLDTDLTLEDTHDHIILRAEWNDKAMLRNYLGLEVFRNATWIPTPQAEIVHFRINGRYYGVMWHVERIGGDFLRVRGLNHTTCSMYEADPYSYCWSPGGDLTPVDDIATYQCIYDQKKGEVLYDDLIDLIENTLQLPDDEFESTIDDVVDVNEYLVYMATMATIQNHDHIKKNYFLYRDPSASDDRWIVLPWDMELTFGHLWSEENDVLEETIVTDAALDTGICPGFCNHLMTRIYNIPKYQVRFYEFVHHILSTTFTRDFIDERIDNVLCRAAPDIVADSNKRAELSEYESRVDEIRDFVDVRRAFILD